MLCTLHNLRYLFRLVDRARAAIAAGTLGRLLAEFGLDEDRLLRSSGS